MIVASRQLDKKLPQKQQLIVAELRSQIVEGRLAAGAQLPTHVELSQRFGVSNVTIQRALDRLLHEGFIVANGRRGTFVAPRPPHTSRYALCFPSSYATDMRWPNSRFWNSLVQEAARVGAGRDVSVYYDINARCNSEDYHRLVDDLACHRLAGLIFMVPHATMQATLPGADKLPRIIVGSEDAPGTRRILLDPAFPRALEHLASRGRKNLAILTTQTPGPQSVAQWQEHAQRVGMTTHAGWVHGVEPTYAPWARNLVPLLFPAQGPRPDALFITDDNLVEAVTQGLLDAGVRVPQDLEVVAHCNFPWMTPSLVPARRIGYNLRDLLSRCVDAIDAWRAGKPPTHLHLPACFEQEVLGAAPAPTQALHLHPGDLR